MRIFKHAIDHILYISPLAIGLVVEWELGGYVALGVLAGMWWESAWSRNKPARIVRRPPVNPDGPPDPGPPIRLRRL